MHQNDSDEERDRRQRQRQEVIAGGVLGGALVAALGYGAYKLYGALSAEPRRQMLTEGDLVENCDGSSQWFNRLNFSAVLKSFWKNVGETRNEEISAIKKEIIKHECEENLMKLEFQSAGVRRYRHKYNKFDPWFHNLLKNVLRLDSSETQECKVAFNEIFTILVNEMGNVDPLFRFLYRNFVPAGSTWEELKLYSSDEYDVNLVLNIPSDAKVEYLGYGHVAINLINGFHVNQKEVKKKFPNDKWELYHASITAKLKKWICASSYVSRSAVLEWFQGCVASALFQLTSRGHRWTHIQDITSCSRSGPAVTLKVTMRNFKKISIDFVPVFEFSREHLPSKIKDKIQTICRTPNNRKWFAVPKGRTQQASPKMWRTSLYDDERDLMKGLDHLKPSIRIMKRLRDVQEWKALSSYYIKTTFMWMMEERDTWQCGLGQLVMQGMKSLEEALRKRCIKYYWDDDMNLLENVANEEFFKNVSNYLNRIIKTFERSLNDDSVDPMHFFGCDKEGNLLPSPSELQVVRQETYGRSDNFRNQPDENCAVM